MLVVLYNFTRGRHTVRHRDTPQVSDYAEFMAFHKTLFHKNDQRNKQDLLINISRNLRGHLSMGRTN